MPRLSPRAITFDAAGTLVDVRYEPVGFMLELLREQQIEVDEETLRTEYLPMRVARQGEYAQAIQAMGARGRRAFWKRFTADLLSSIGVPLSEGHLARMSERSDELLLCENSPYWRLYPDVREALSLLRRRGARLAVVSNWDDTLHPVLELLGIAQQFEFALASLEVGWEKPDPRIFGRAVGRLGYEPFEVAHVGDNPLDDGEGAARAGLFPIIVDRDGAYPGLPFARIRSLTDLALLYE
ncbi:MAG: HAD-IA family hydrolase [Fimbriimonadia bacterium]|jgi:HAD superfamily hydrolase (TIGR01549 family)